MKKEPFMQYMIREIKEDKLAGYYCMFILILMIVLGFINLFTGWF